jgi:transposase
MESKFKPVDRKTPFLLPPSLEDWLPEDHLARFIVDVVSMLDLTPIRESYAGRGSRAYDPAVLLSLLFYGYATGIFSSRKIEAATYDSVAFRYIAANSHPDHDTIASFRKRFLSEINGYFFQILQIARKVGLARIGAVSLDGTKLKANASKHKAMSWKYANKLEKQLKAEVEKLLELAEKADAGELEIDMDIPEELKRRQDRLKTIADAKAEIERRAEERYQREKEDYDEYIEQRERKEKQTGKKTRGKPRKKPEPGPCDKDQVNFTEKDSRIMRTSGGGFEQGYNGQAVVDNENGLIVENHISQISNDKRELGPALEGLEKVPEELGKPETLIADAGYFSKENVENCISKGIEPYISFGREQHNFPLEERFTKPGPPPTTEDPLLLMKSRLSTPAGRKIYGQRKGKIEPVFGVIKQVMGFRQFLLRGVDAVRGEWSLVCSAFNLKRMHKLLSIS